jgi:hypothetical protein
LLFSERLSWKKREISVPGSETNFSLILTKSSAALPVYGFLSLMGDLIVPAGAD